MVKRFHIEDLVAQDASGVVFRATDGETGAMVAVRRFFPFGTDGGGLSAGEAAEYEGVVARLLEIRHPGLRETVCGGCDPVDAMPYIVTEWVPGRTLADYIGNAPLAPEDAAGVLARAMEICEMVSASFDRDEVWIDTSPGSMVATEGDAGRGVTFWISPLKCLGKRPDGRGLEPLALLAEALTGWYGRKYGEQTAHGLAGWIFWLRGSQRTTTLREARQKLSEAMGAPPPATALPHPAHQPARSGKLSKKKKRSVLPTLIAGVAGLALVGAVGWFAIWRHSANLVKAATVAPLPAIEVVAAPGITPISRDLAEPEPARRASSFGEPKAEAPPETPKIAGESPEQRANRLAVEMSDQAREATAQADAKTNERKKEIASHAGVFGPGDRDLLLAQRGKAVILEGVLAEIGFSNTKATMYLQFSKSPAATEARGAIRVKSAPPELAQAKLAALIGRKIRLHGRVSAESFPGGRRPVIMISKGNAIHAE